MFKFSFIWLGFITLLLSCAPADLQYTAQVKEFNGKPVLYINDTISYPMIYSLTGVAGARMSYDDCASWNIKRFGEAGIRIYQGELWPAVIYNYQTKTFNKELIARQIRGFVEQNPNAAIILRLQTQIHEWSRENPDECVGYADTIPEIFPEFSMHHPGRDDTRNLLAPSFGSEKWKKFANNYLTELIAVIKSIPESSHVIGFNVCGGIYGEWHDWGGIEFNPDNGKAMTFAFQKWLKNKYGTAKNLQKAWNNPKIQFENVQCPTMEERTKTEHGIFRNPQTQRNVIDYYECMQLLKVDMIKTFCKTVKTEWGRPAIVGLFYGYFFNVFGRNAAFGHLRLDSLLNCPDIDYLAGPQSYMGFARDMGGSGQSRSIQDACRLHGKLYIDEMDMKTSLGEVNGRNEDSLLNADLAIIKRNIAQPFTNGTGCWFYDFGNQLKTGWWDHNLFMNQIKASKSLFDSLYQLPLNKNADVLFVYDPGVYSYTAPTWILDPVTHTGVEWGSNAAYKSGIVFDQCILTDLPDINLKPYKAIVFVNTFVIDDSMRKFIMEHVLTDNRHVIWNYMPGVINKYEFNPTFTQQLTGFNLELVQLKNTPRIVSGKQLENAADLSVWTPVPVLIPQNENLNIIGNFTENNLPGLVSKQMSNYTSWFCSLPLSSEKFMNYIFTNAGCHIYSNNFDVIHSGNGLLVLHTKAGGEKKITLLNGKHLTLNVKPNSTIYIQSTTGQELIK